MHTVWRNGTDALDVLRALDALRGREADAGFLDEVCVGAAALGRWRRTALVVPDARSSAIGAAGLDADARKTLLEAAASVAIAASLPSGAGEGRSRPPETPDVAPRVVPGFWAALRDHHDLSSLTSVAAPAGSGPEGALLLALSRHDGSPLATLVLSDPAEDLSGHGAALDSGAPDRDALYGLRVVRGFVETAVELFRERRRAAEGATDEASGILRLVESLNAVEDLQELLDRLAEAAARTAGWHVAVLSVYLPEGALLGGWNLPDAERARFLRAMETTPLERRLGKRKQIRSFAFADTGIAYVPHDADLARSAAFSTSDPRSTGSWHPEDRLFVLVRTGTGQEIGVLSLDEPLDGNAPRSETLGSLRVVERLLELGASFLYSRVLARDLRRSEEAYRALVDGAPVGIYRRDASERVHSCNPRLAEIFGYASPDALMADASFPALFRTSDREAIQRALAASGEVRNFDMKARRVDGTAIRLRMAVRLDRDGQVQGIVEDVTEAKRLEEHLQRAQRIEAVGTLASGVAHDFNNLLAGILGYASLLDQRLADEPALGAMARAIQAAALRAADLTRGLLGIARPPSGEPTRVDAASVLADVARIAHETFDRRITTTVVVEGVLPPALVIASELHRAVLNLCINARDAMPEGGAITLSAVADQTGPRTPPSGTHTGPWVRIDVRDTGFGMDEAVKARIFEPFFTTKPRGKGTGLGLYGVYQFVTASSGAVDVDSQPGAGTCFHVFVPAATAAEPEATPPPPKGLAGTGPTGPSACILLIEDEDAIRRFAGTILREVGHVVVEAADGEEAVRVFSSDPARYDLLLLDLMLPRLSGREVLLRCRAIRSDVPILLSSGNVRDGLDDPHVRGAIQGVLPKPYLPAHLVESVRSALLRRA